MEKFLRNICNQFNINGEFQSYKQITYGHINSTFLVKFLEEGNVKEYIVQRINSYVFKNPFAVMSNIQAVTNHINKKNEKSSSKINTLNFHPSSQGFCFYLDENDDFWRVSDFIKNSKTINETDNLKIIEEAGLAFGEFQQYLADMPADQLYEIIPQFHNTQNRYKIFKDTLMADPQKRSKEVLTEIEEYLNLEDLATTMHKMQTSGQLPLKVTHNDTKCNNVLFDKDTNKRLCVIDLDTVMPGLLGFDFGDAIRFIANTCKEDETNLDLVTIDFQKYKAFTKGFLQAVGKSLTENEKNTLALGAITMTVECGVRFLTDYIDGDKYFKTEYPDHNLDRARCQLKLAKEMQKNYKTMQSIVDENYIESQQQK